MKNILQPLKICVLSAALVFTFACSDDDDDKAKACETDDFGFVKATIPNSEFETEFLYTEMGSSSSISRIIDAGQTSGTMEVPSGTYTVSVTQIDDDGFAVTDPVVFTNLVVEQCGETVRTVSFE